MRRIGKIIKYLRAFAVAHLLAIAAPCISAENSKSAADYDNMFVEVQGYLNKGKNDIALDLLNKISEKEISSVDDTTKVLYNMLLGKTYLLRQEYGQAELYLGKAISMYETLGFKYPSYIDMLVFRAYASDALGKRDDAAVWYRKALVKGKVLEHNNDLDNCCYLNLGNIYNEAGNYNLANEYYRNVRWIDSLQRVEIHGDYYGRTCERYRQAGVSDDWLKAKEINDSLTDYCLTKYGEANDFYLACLQSKGTVQNRLQDYGQAEIPYKEILRIGKKHSLQSYYVGDAYCRLIECYFYQNKKDDALALYPEAVEYIKRLADKNISEVEPCFFIGMVCVKNKDYETGVAALEKFLSMPPDYMQWAVPYARFYLTGNGQADESEKN